MMLRPLSISSTASNSAYTITFTVCVSASAKCISTRGNTRTCRSRTHTRSVRMCAQHTAWERANDAARKGATAEVSDQITTASTQEREREAETPTSTTDRWILTNVASSVGSLCRHTIATSTVCMILILVDQSGPEWTRGPGDQGTGNCDG